MCFACGGGGWPWSQPVHLAALPVKEEHVFLDSAYEFYPDYRTVSEESCLPAQFSNRSGNTSLPLCHFNFILDSLYLYPSTPTIVSITIIPAVHTSTARCGKFIRHGLALLRLPLSKWEQEERLQLHRS